MSEYSKTTIPQQAFDWYDEYAHGDINRRTFLSRLSSLALSGAAISVITQGLTPNYALAEQVSFNDPQISARYQKFDSPLGYGQGQGYLVTPVREGLDVASAPRVLVVHENRGLNPYIRDVARRLAKQGFVAFAPDALYPLGGYPGNDDEGRTMQRSMDRNKIEQDFCAAARYLKVYKGQSTKVGVVGFCFGGYISNYLAAAVPEVIDAAVPFYGSPAPQDMIKNIRGALLLQYAELDKRVNATWPDYKAALDAMSANYEAHVYPGVNHGFHNDSTSRYAPQEAELAWQRTLDFFNKHLS